MAIRGDSYGSTTEVKAYTRHLLSGEVSFNSTTRPTGTELEKFIDRASGLLNGALSGKGLTTPITNTTAKLACADWVVTKAAQYVELTQRGAGFSDREGSRTTVLGNLHKQAMDFAAMHELAFKRLGVGVSHAVSDGLVFTGEKARDERTDKDDTSLRKPAFRRNQFSALGDDDDDDVEDYA